MLQLEIIHRRINYRSWFGKKIHDGYSLHLGDPERVSFTLHFGYEWRMKRYDEKMRNFGKKKRKDKTSYEFEIERTTHKRLTLGISVIFSFPIVLPTSVSSGTASLSKTTTSPVSSLPRSITLTFVASACLALVFPILRVLFRLLFLLFEIEVEVVVQSLSFLAPSPSSRSNLLRLN